MRCNASHTRSCARMSLFCVASCIVFVTTVEAAQPVVPGTGRRISDAGDDFEDPEWTYIHNLPKSSKNLNEFTGGRSGSSTNGRWYEGMKRGQPDYIKRISTPEGGLPGSTGSLALMSLQTGVPNRPSYQQQQDDFICNVMNRVGQIPVSRVPSVVTRVYLPPVDKWENRTGCHFAFRLALETTARKKSKGGLFGGGSKMENEPYWPGMFINFDSKEGKGATGKENDYAYIRIRGNTRGGDFTGMQIEKTGWWTLGMSVTGDGMVHYYAKPGIEDLTDDDYITSQYPYGYRAERFRNFFFNVCNGDDGKTWSTTWIVDDPSFYVR